MYIYETRKKKNDLPRVVCFVIISNEVKRTCSVCTSAILFIVSKDLFLSQFIYSSYKTTLEFSDLFI